MLNSQNVKSIYTYRECCCCRFIIMFSSFDNHFIFIMSFVVVFVLITTTTTTFWEKNRYFLYETKWPINPRMGGREIIFEWWNLMFHPKTETNFDGFLQIFSICCCWLVVIWMIPIDMIVKCKNIRLLTASLFLLFFFVKHLVVLVFVLFAVSLFLNVFTFFLWILVFLLFTNIQ